MQPRYKVLHVDDNTSFLKLFATRFHNFLDITSLDNGREALDVVHLNPFDVIIIDYEMVEMNGLQLLERIKQDFPNMPVIFYTGQGNEEVAREAFMLGVSDYFVKDIAGFAYKERLLNAIRNAVEKSKAEKALKESEENLEAIMQSISEAVIATDLEGNISLMNPVAADITGWTQEEAHGKQFTEVFSIFNQATGEAEENPITRILASEAPVNVVSTQLKSKNNGPRFVSFSGAAIKNKSGKTTGVVIVFHDITQSREQSQAILLLQNSLEKSNVPFFLVDDRGRIVSVNSAACEVFGFTCQELRDSDIFRIIPQDCKDKWEAHWEESRDRSVVFQSEYCRKDGTKFPVEVTHNHLLIEGKEYHFVFVRSI